MTQYRRYRLAQRRSVFTSRLVNTAQVGQAPHVLEDLRAAILAGDEPPGTAIPIDAVAEFFGVSQIPVREALKILLGEGLVDHVPHVGYSVAKLSFSEFSELYQVRKALEISALRAAVVNATPDDDAHVKQTHDAMLVAMFAGDERGYHLASRGFHTALIRPSGMDRLLHMYESAWNVTEPARPMALVSESGRKVFYDDHARMAEAFSQRDTEALLAEAIEHYDHLVAGLAALATDSDNFLQPDDVLAAEPTGS